jgi:hypothetical protein
MRVKDIALSRDEYTVLGSCHVLGDSRQIIRTPTSPRDEMAVIGIGNSVGSSYNHWTICSMEWFSLD